MNKRPTDSPVFILHLRPTPAGKDHLQRDPYYRLKVALKVLLRRFGLRCIDLTERTGK